MSEDFIKEVDEDIKEEKRIKLWKKLLPYVLGFSLTVIFDIRICFLGKLHKK